MKESFFGFYRPSDEQLSDLWKSCIFVLDANVLLNLYRYPRQAREDMLKILRMVSDRLWIPHQVALEYQQNRLDVIAEQVKRFDEAEKTLRDIEGKLQGDLGKLQLKKRHSLIDPDGFLKRVGEIFGEFMTELAALRQEQPDVYHGDKLRDELDSLLEGRVGPAPQSQEELDQTYKEAEERFRQKRPPGYMDADKASDHKEAPYMYGGLAFRREYGDLVLWYQIIGEAQTEDHCKKIIFVTDDDKEDWWWIVESQGKKTIGPRPELAEEIRSKAGVSLFYMYNSERFMRLAEKYLGAEIERESIERVRDVAQLDRVESQWRGRGIREMYLVAEKAVLEWLRAMHPRDEVFENRERFPDFIRVGHEAGRRHGYEVKAFSAPQSVAMMMREALYRGYYEVSEGRLSTFEVILVALGDFDHVRISSILQ